MFAISNVGCVVVVSPLGESSLDTANAIVSVYSMTYCYTLYNNRCVLTIWVDQRHLSTWLEVSLIPRQRVSGNETTHKESLNGHYHLMFHIAM